MVVEDVRFLTDRTVYSRIGDLVAWLSLAHSRDLVALAVRWRCPALALLAVARWPRPTLAVRLH